MHQRIAWVKEEPAGDLEVGRVHETAVLRDEALAFPPVVCG
jgi:hypothetical protein